MASEQFKQYQQSTVVHHQCCTSSTSVIYSSQAQTWPYSSLTHHRCCHHRRQTTSSAFQQHLANSAVAAAYSWTVASPKQSTAFHCKHLHYKNQCQNNTKKGTQYPIPNNIGLCRYQYPIPIPILVYSIVMTTKSPKTMTMTMIVFNKQLHISMVSRQTIVSVRVQVTIGTK